MNPVIDVLVGESGAFVAALVDRLTTGCRILAEQQILDAYGHLSARHPDEPDHFLISRAMSPALVTKDDFVVLDGEGNLVQGSAVPNVEWPIHACIYASRPEVGSVLHSHSRLSRIFSMSNQRLRGTITSSAPEWGNGVPVYRSPGLVTTADRGFALAEVLGNESAALLRGHGDVVVAVNPVEVVLKTINLKMNADILHEILSHRGDVDYWDDEEISVWRGPQHKILSPEAQAVLDSRVWNYYEARVNGHLARLLNQ